MKAILEFNLPEDSADFEYCSKGPKLFGAIWDLLNDDLRSKIKYEIQNAELTANEADKFRTYLINYFTKCGLIDTINSD